MAESTDDVLDFGYVDSPGNSFLDTLANNFDAAFLAVAAVLALGVLSVFFMILRNIKAARRAGMNPATMQTDLAAKVMNSGLLAPAPSKEARLAELDDLLVRSVISAAEHETARMEILGGR
ncbi:hypothetical protein E9229_002276 [Paeniglutamicibacter cryotolerans]|uniref:Uncharacterized protein n=1 Tax=Paeniglutamicibacter cryotolerans TaxID=670079 RepID=A0A839QN83_9MICC|nr:hypothetical protein [Paeniglutamicibacter cryotolerans]